MVQELPGVRQELTDLQVRLQLVELLNLRAKRKTSVNIHTMAKKTRRASNKYSLIFFRDFNWRLSNFGLVKTDNRIPV